MSGKKKKSFIPQKDVYNKVGTFLMELTILILLLNASAKEIQIRCFWSELWLLLKEIRPVGRRKQEVKEKPGKL